MAFEPDNVFFIGNTRIQKVVVPKKTKPVPNDPALQCTICNVKIQVRAIQFIKSIEVLRELIREGIPNFNESADSFELCGQCQQEVLEYHEFCKVVYEKKIRFLDALRKSHRIREIERAYRVEQSIVIGSRQSESPLVAEKNTVVEKKPREILTRKALIYALQEETRAMQQRCTRRRKVEKDAQAIMDIERPRKEDDNSQLASNTDLNDFPYISELDDDNDDFKWPESTSPRIELPPPELASVPLVLLCEICGKEFKKADALRRHSLIHADIKPFQCDQCPKQFRTAGERKSHAYIHTGVKPHACPFCPRRYVATSSLNLHIAEYHEGRPPKTLHYCRLCEEGTVAFDRLSLLNKHMIRKHNTELETQSWRRSRKKEELKPGSPIFA